MRCDRRAPRPTNARGGGAESRARPLAAAAAASRVAASQHAVSEIIKLSESRTRAISIGCAGAPPRAPDVPPRSCEYRAAPGRGSRRRRRTPALEPGCPRVLR